MFISETARICKILRNGTIQIVAGTGRWGYNGDDQLAVKCQVNKPCGMWVVEDGEELLFCDSENHRVRRIDKHGVMTTIAGMGEGGYNGDDQLAIHARLNRPRGVCVYEDEIYIADAGNHRIRKILRNGVIVTIAGSGKEGYSRRKALDSDLNFPSDLVVLRDGIYFTDEYNSRIRKIERNGTITTLAGTEIAGYNGDGFSAQNSQVNNPTGIQVYKGQVIFTDCFNQRIRKIDEHGNVVTLVGNCLSGYSGDSAFDFKTHPHRGLGSSKFSANAKNFFDGFFDVNFTFQE